MDNFLIRQQPTDDCADFLTVVRDAAARMEARNLPMWTSEELTEDRIRRAYGDGLYVGYLRNNPAATVALIPADDFLWGAGSGEANALYVYNSTFAQPI